MPNKKITFDAVGLNVTTNTVTVNRINLKPDNSGDWNIGVDFVVSTPSRTTTATVSIMERHIVSSTITVKKSEIAAAANITEEEVRTVLTLSQTETWVTQIAMAKLFAAMSINAQNVVVV